MSFCNYNQAWVMGKILNIPTVRYSKYGEPTAHMYVSTKTPEPDALPYAGNPWSDRSLSEEWVFVVCHDELAEKVQRELDGGDLVVCNGSMSTVSWKDGHGKRHKDYALVAKSVSVVTKAAFNDGKELDNKI